MQTILEEETINVKAEKQSFLPKLRKMSMQLSALESDLSMFWNSSAAMLIIEKNGSIINYNPSFLKNTGLTDYYINSNNLISITHPIDRKKLFLSLNSLRNKLENQEIVVRIASLINPDWIYVKMSLSYDADSNTTFCIATSLKNKCLNCPF